MYYPLLQSTKAIKESSWQKSKELSYTLGENVWLNSKYIKTKQNKKLENKFFGLFRVFYAVAKQAYKLKLSTK